MSRAKQILIVGGGVIGLCTAYSAMQEGHHVTIVERGPSDHDMCSLGNAGMIVPSHFVPLAAPGMIGYGLRAMWKPESPFSIRPRLDGDLLRWGLLFARAANADHVARSAPLLRDLNLASRRCYEAMADRFGDVFGLTKRGLLMLCRTEQALHEEAQAAQQACRLGLSAAVHTPQEAAELDPGVRMDIAGAVHFPQDCHLTPGAFVARLTDALTEGGTQFQWGTAVTGWRTAGGRIDAVQTAQGDMTADEYVLAGGSWSPQTVRSLGLRLPMQAGKGYSITLPQPRQQPQLCSIFTEARVAVTPMGSSLRFGGTMEITGLDLSVSRPRVNGILKAIPQYFPDFTVEDFRDLPVWSGLRPCSPDGLPYVGRFGRYANLSAATGHAMMGMSLGPVTGKLMADILSGRPTEIDISTLSPDRYG
jgi:D-amino-acid dehydrogenase